MFPETQKRTPGFFLRSHIAVKRPRAVRGAARGVHQDNSLRFLSGLPLWSFKGVARMWCPTRTVPYDFYRGCCCCLFLLRSSTWCPGRTISYDFYQACPCCLLTGQSNHMTPRPGQFLTSCIQVVFCQGIAFLWCWTLI